MNYKVIDDIVVNLIALNDGELVGRIRLQKLAYLLHRCGANFDVPFVYHHYGPYAPLLANACLSARAERRITIEERPGRYGVPYAIFRIAEDVRPPTGIGALPADKALASLTKIKRASDIALELAATIVFLRDDDRYGAQAVRETAIRKPRKTTPERMQAAFGLIRDLGLDPNNALVLPD